MEAGNGLPAVVVLSHVNPGSSGLMIAAPLAGGKTALEKFSVYGNVNVGATVKLMVVVSFDVLRSVVPFGLIVNICKTWSPGAGAKDGVNLTGDELLKVVIERLLKLLNDPNGAPSSIIPTSTVLKVSVPKFLIRIVGTMGNLQSKPLLGSITAPIVASVCNSVDAGVTCAHHTPYLESLSAVPTRWSAYSCIVQIEASTGSKALWL